MRALLRIGAYFFRDRGRKAAETQLLLEQLSHPRGRRWFLPGGEISWFGSKSEFIAGRKKTGRKGAAYNHEALAFSLSIKRIHALRSILNERESSFAVARKTRWNLEHLLILWRWSFRRSLHSLRTRRRRKFCRRRRRCPRNL